MSETPRQPTFTYQERFCFESESALAEFRKLSDRILAHLLTIREETAPTRKRYSQSGAWLWFTKNRPHLIEKCKRLALMKGEASAIAFIRAEWEAEFPRRPVGRPTGHMTTEYLRSVANGRALALLLKYSKIDEADLPPKHSPPPSTAARLADLSELRLGRF
jgi:hypothetical protein